MQALQQYDESAEVATAVAYVRLSKNDTGSRSAATHRQEESIREHAARWGDEITKVYVDDDRSASEDEQGFIKSRDGFNEMLEAISLGWTPPKVYYYAHDRFLRNVEEGEQVRRWAQKHGVSLVCCVSGGPVNLDDENGVFNFQLNTLLGRKETAATSRRIRETFERTVIAKGTSLGGKPPFGYRQVGAKAPDGTDTRIFEIVPEEAEAVRDVIGRVAAGQTLTRIADDLNERGIITRRTARNGWTITSVRRIAMNGRYAGRMIHKGTDRGASAYPPIVDEATWRQAVAVLTDPKRAKRRSSRKYLLSGGVLRCGKCGRPLHSRPVRSRNGEVRTTYGCASSKHPTAPGCGGVSIDAAQVEKMITAAVIDHIESAQYAAQLRRLVAKTPKAGAGVKEIEARQEKVTQLFMRGRMTAAVYEQAMEEAASQLAHLQATVTGDTATAAVGRYAGRKGVLQRDWDNDERPMSLDRKQAIIRAVLDHVVIVPLDGKGGKVFRPERVSDPIWR